MHRFGDHRHLVAREHAAGRVVRRVDDDRLRPLRERLAQTIRIERPVGPLERHEHRRRAGENRVGTVVLVERLEDDHFVARIDQRHEHRRHRFRRAAGHRHVRDRDRPPCSYQRRYFSAIAWRSTGVPHVTAYWLMSP